MNLPFDNLYGNDVLKARLENDFFHKTFSHAYIIEGAKGTGKHTLSDIIAAGIGCSADLSYDTLGIPCGTCESCRKILSHISPDIIYVVPEGDKKSMGVDVIRSIHSSAYIKPSELDYKFFIIFPAQQMTAAAQNALLLMLEEPPKDVYFLLLCDKAVNLLPTIRSRAQTIRMQLFTDDEITSHLIETDSNAAEIYNKRPSEFEFAIKNALGSIGDAKDAVRDLNKNTNDKKESDNPISVYSSVNGIFDRLTKQRSYELSVYFSQMNPEREEAISFLSNTEKALRDIIAVKCCEQTGLMFFESEDVAKDYASHFTKKCIMKMYDYTVETKENITMNSNISISLAALSVKFCDLIKNS